MIQFCEDEHHRCLVIPESLKLDSIIPSKLSPKLKILVMIKLQQVVLKADNIQSNVITMELSGPSPFEHLELIANEVFLPILSNPLNQTKWGEVPTREIMVTMICI